MSNFYKHLMVLVTVILFMNGGLAWGETLKDAIKYMLQTNPDIIAGAHNRLAKEQEVRQAKANYYPNVYVSSGVGVTNQSHPFYSTVWPKSTVLSLRQNLFRFFGTEYEVNRLKYTATSQAYRLQDTAEHAALLASKVYLDVLRNLELYNLAKENLTNHERISDQMKLRSASGVDRKADLDQVMGRLALAQSNVVIAATNTMDAKTAYLAAVGRLPGTLIKPESVDSVIPESIEAAEQLAMRGYPVLKSAQADLDARIAQYKTAKSQIFPTFDLSVDYGWQNDVNITGYQERLSATASVNFDIFNGWYTDARISQTAQQIREAEAIRNNTKRQIIQSVRLSWEAYKAAQEKVVYLEEYVKAAGLTAEAFAAQWNIGRRTMFDLLDTQAEYISAKSSLANAQYDKLYAEYRIMNSVGKLVHTFGLQWPEQSRVVTATLDVPRHVEPSVQKDSGPLAPSPVAPLVIEAPKPAGVVTDTPQTSESPKQVAIKTSPAVVSLTGSTEKHPQPPTYTSSSNTARPVKESTPAVASSLTSDSADQPKIIKGIVLLNGKVVEGQILSMNAHTVKILTKDGREEAFSFEKEIKGFIKESVMYTRLVKK
jgi:adhesin transport system outer membrane protein